ncbi:MAG TPA: hypothetical protein VN623_03850 [Hyphomicrobium sp.]|uniref:hypothetical protein n=1 Tax=Hyphomicrobium sp. TaxID=82 RepID=UPI002CC60716|nr:hypothetical protein [Hyphomicrobium sp.]HXE01065.1 hypothetical protein [Hyphomicrobium sp.]
MKNMICNVYLTGSSGQSFGMFYFGKDFFVGADIGGIKYDGTFVQQQDGSLEGTVKFVIPAGTQLITGMAAGSEPQQVAGPLNLPKDFATSNSIVRIDTPAGPVMARFEMLREVP